MADTGNEDKAGYRKIVMSRVEAETAQKNSVKSAALLTQHADVLVYGDENELIQRYDTGIPSLTFADVLSPSSR